MESSQIRDWTRVSRIGRWVLYHWATKEAPFGISCREGLVITHFLSLWLSETVFLCLKFFRDKFISYRILCWQFFFFFFSFSTLHVIPLPPGLQFLMRNQLLILSKILCTWWATSVLLFSRVSVFSFNSLIMMHSMGLFWFYLSWDKVCWASWICSFIKFVKLLAFSPYFFRYSLYAFLCLSYGGSTEP